MSRQAFIDDVSAGLKEKIAIVTGSMDLSPELLPAFRLGMSCATDVFLSLTDGRHSSKAPYRIYPVEYVATPAVEPIPYYEYGRDIERTGETNDLLHEIWEKVSS